MKKDRKLGHKFGAYEIEDHTTILEPDYDYFLKLDTWTIKQSVFIIHNQHPLAPIIPIDEHGEPYGSIKTDYGFNNEMKQTEDILKNSIESGSISIIKDKLVKPDEIISLAKSKGYELHSKLLERIRSTNRIDVNEPFKYDYLDNNHKYFSEELQIAIETWGELFGKEKFIEKNAPKKQIEDLLKSKHKGLSKGALNRIATLVNPKKQGGAPKTAPD